MRSEQAGFTIFELLIGFAIGAAAIVIAGAGISAAMAAKRQVEMSSPLVEDISALALLQQRVFSRAVPLQTGDGPEAPWLFEGDSAHASFVVAMWGDPGTAGLWRLRLSLQTERQRTTLSIDGETYEASKQGAPHEFRQFATSEIQSGARFLFGRVNEDGWMEWSPQWRPSDGWPALLAIDPNGNEAGPNILFYLPDAENSSEK